MNVLTVRLLLFFLFKVIINSDLLISPAMADENNVLDPLQSTALHIKNTNFNVKPVISSSDILLPATLTEIKSEEGGKSFDLYVSLISLQKPEGPSISGLYTDRPDNWLSEDIPEKENKPGKIISESNHLNTIQTVIPGSNTITGGEHVYIVIKGETIRLISARLGLNWRQLAIDNGINPNNPVLKPGIELHYNNRKIVPNMCSDGLLINIPDRTLYYFEAGELIEMSPVTVGSQDVKCQTPTGAFTITCKSKNPTWTVPPSIQQEMINKGKAVVKLVPPGKNNPLGKFAMRTTMGNIMLHSTNNPTSIYGFRSHGCIRVFPDNMKKIFDHVGLNTRGEIIYLPVKVAITTGGRIFFEVNPDAYYKIGDLLKEAQRIAKLYNITEQIDWDKSNRLIKEKTGIAEDVTREQVAINDKL